MINLNKKIFLVLIVIAEIAIGSYFIFQYQQYKLIQSKVLGASNVAIIDKTKIEIESTDDFKYYWKHKPSQKIEDNPEWLPYKATYNINSDGLNDLDNYPIEKEKDTYRIVALGDSFTYGQFVDTKDNWTEQIEVMLNNDSADFSNKCYEKIEVINLGMPAFDVKYIVKRYEEIGKKYNPDLITWFESSSGFSRYSELAEPMIEECLALFESVSTKEHVICWKKAEKQVKEQHSEEELDKIILDSYHSFFKLTDQDKTMFFYYNQLDFKEVDFVRKLSIIYSDVSFLSIIPQPTKKELLPDNHPNKLGHKTIATHIYNYLLKSKKICD